MKRVIISLLVIGLSAVSFAGVFGYDREVAEQKTSTNPNVCKMVTVNASGYVDVIGHQKFYLNTLGVSANSTDMLLPATTLVGLPYLEKGVTLSFLAFDTTGNIIIKITRDVY